MHWMWDFNGLHQELEALQPSHPFEDAIEKSTETPIDRWIQHLSKYNVRVLGKLRGLGWIGMENILP